MSITPKDQSAVSPKWGSVEWFQIKFQTQDKGSSASYFGHSASAYQTMRHTELVSLCQRTLPFEPLHIVDYGCATGELTARFAKAWPQANTRGYDFVPELVDAASQANKDIQFGVSGLPDVEKIAADRTLVILSEVLYYLEVDAQRECLKRLVASAERELVVLFTSVVGPHYFTPKTATALFEAAGFEVDLHVTSLPRYKKLIGAASAYEGLLAKISVGTAGERRAEKLALRFWKVPPLRWIMLGFRSGARMICKSKWLLRIANRFEDTPLNRARAPSNLVLVAKVIR